MTTTPSNDPLPIPPSTPPTDGELEILQTLWARGPSTVREVHSALGRETGYTSVLKLLQIMHAKGWVERDESERAHVYTAARDREAVEGGLVRDLLDRAFGGSASRLVLRALSVRPIPAEERRRIEELLDASDEATREEEPR